MKIFLQKALSVFEVIFSFFVTNIMFIVGSIASLLFFFPVILVSTMNFLRRMYYYKEYNGIIFTFISGIKGKIIKSFKVIFPLLILLGILIASVFYYNQVLTGVFPDFVIIIIFMIQFLIIYQLTAIILVCAIELSIDTQSDSIDMYKRAFLLINTHPIRTFFSMLTLIVVIALSLQVISYAYLVFIPLSLMAFYIVFSDVYEKSILMKS